MTLSPELIDLLLKAGPTGVVILLFVLGYVVPKPAADRMAADADRWRQAYETEHAAHETTRGALIDQAKAATAAIAAAQTTEKLLSEIKQRPGAPA